jgi:hypothetical protein
VYNRVVPLDLTHSDLSIDAISSGLDALPDAERWEAIRRCDRDQQRRLFGLAAASDMRIDDLVPGAAPLEEVIHSGVNTLPVPWALRRFEKRFCRAEDDANVLFGYNEGPLRRIIGPGYFVARDNAHAEWAERGGVVVDYWKVPDGRVAVGWPRIIPNEQGLQRNVYAHTRDFLRRLSAHVTIGMATKDDQPIDHYFLLCRRD